MMAAIAALAGCTNSGQNPGPADPSAAQTLAIGRQFSECARVNGMPAFPDPVLDAEGGLSFPGATKEDLKVVEGPCGAIIQQVSGLYGGGNQTPSAEQMQAMRQFAECFRANGVPEWPDPNPDGTFPIVGTPLEAELNSNPLPERFVSARRICDRYRR
jgi:hypothetical protein